MSHKNASSKCLIKMSHQNILANGLIKMSNQNVSSKCLIEMSHQNVSSKWMSHQKVPSKCLIKCFIKMYHQNVPSKCPIKMSKGLNRRLEVDAYDCTDRLSASLATGHKPQAAVSDGLRIHHCHYCLGRPRMAQLDSNSRNMGEHSAGGQIYSALLWIFLAPKFFSWVLWSKTNWSYTFLNWISWQFSSNWLFQINADSDLERAQTSEHCYTMQSIS